ncbi:MAG: AAA family ATPase [Pseudomonadota bacterium]
MALLFIGSTGDRAGHSLITWAIARRLSEIGLRVGFAKPFGTNPVYCNDRWTDHDALLFKQFLNLPYPLERICPHLITGETGKQAAMADFPKRFKSLVDELSSKSDILLIMGSKHIFFDESTCPVPDIAIINELNADFILINRFRKTSSSIYSILFAKSMIKEKFKGVFLNRIPPGKFEDIRKGIVPALSDKGIPCIAALQEDPSLSFRSLREIREVLSGELLCGEEELGRLVGRATVGSTELKGSLQIFKRVYNKIILLAPFPSDKGLHEPLPERNVAGILLTAGRKPAAPVLETAKNNHIPLMLVKEDTFSVLECLDKNPPRLSPADETKVRQMMSLLDRDGALDTLIKSMGLIPRP